MKKYTIMKDGVTYVVSANRYCEAFEKAQQLFEIDFILEETNEIVIDPEIAGTLIQ